MSELGQQLKEARLQKGLSLDDVQEMTKIRKRYLEAIESGDYKVLPGSFYVRAFIKTYAETVGLNPEELLEGHKKDVPVPEQEATMEPVMQKRSSRPQAERNNKWLSIVLPWTFLALILVLIYFYWVPTLNQAEDPNEPSTGQTDNQPAPNTPEPGTGEDAEETSSEVGGGDPNGEENPDATAPEEGAGQEEESVEDVPVTVTESGTSGNITIFDVTGGSAEEPITVEINASGGSWLEVYKGENSSGEQLVYGNTVAGDQHSFELTSEGMYIKSGYAPATEITVNGQVVTDGKTTNRILLQLAEGEGSEDAQDDANSDSAAGSEDGQ
ncbi:helix-turn-helix domain-containing protein [Paenibacillus provencensis]|uniref:Helix-turn-helix domain-containing protein n=1 Tax=Paenibacillus provencensis TaxID=441151 RepID=A0ABW3PWH7_9BACL|nr:RodZ family helix-turn-helix domain-containing protein [Paenibacillus sp. MER 78]MCM3128783.1 helix-turn-helix domain-containing protein [Paenibacillus sp. MER 78]